MKHLDLFSGIGGFALAASWVWTNHEVVGFCEIDPFCQRVLKKHWPDVPIFDDIKKLKGDQFGTVDLISGGFPCQGFSVAGKQKGKEDDRYLWPEMCRIIEEAKPRWVLGENVAGIISLALDDVLSDLGSLGYETTTFVIPACAVNAPHRRDRVWIIANDGGKREKRIPTNDKDTGQGAELGTESCRNGCNAPDPSARRLQKQGLRHQDKQPSELSQGDREICDAANPRNQGPQGGKRPGPHDKRQAAHGSAAQCRDAWNEPWIEATTRFCRNDARLSYRMDRTNRLKALGNAVVPPLVYEIFKAIKEADR